jgi:isopenicillin-N N-acyltransferase-like protein
MSKIPVLKLSGTPYDMGYHHGLAYADAIRFLTADRLHLSNNPHWTGYELPRPQILALAEACLQAHRDYTPKLVTELQGMADATGLSLPELIIMNGFTDFIDLVYGAGKQQYPQPTPVQAADDCTAFIVPDSTTPDAHGFLGQTWDMHASATPYVILIDGRPQDQPAFLSFSLTGCVGMIGMNEAGIAIGINNLMGGDGQIGVTWPFVIRKALAQTTIDAALECVTSAKLAGAHNYLLFDKHGNGYNIEAMSTRHHIEKLDSECIVHTNHCVIARNLEVERQRPPASQANSELRLSRGQHLLRQRPITEQTLMAVTRDDVAICVRAAPPLEVESCGAAIMRPATGDFWVVSGLPSQNAYEHFTL